MNNIIIKRFLAVFVALVLLFSISGCNKKPEEKPKPTEPSKVEVTKDEFYISEGYVVEKTQPMNESMAEHAVTVFDFVRETYFTNNYIYFAMIPDKHSFAGDKKADYDEFFSYMKGQMPYATAIEIYDLLELSDYYKTDPHWKQECLIDVAQRINSAMGAESFSDVGLTAIEKPYIGVYKDRTDIGDITDTMSYLSNDEINALTVEGADAVYDFKKFDSKDPYEFFLSGNQAVVTVKNASAPQDKRLVVFRDSFACSLAPLLCKGYGEVVFVDLRYIMSDYVGEYVDFEGADILFLYSTLLLNNSFSIK